MGVAGLDARPGVLAMDLLLLILMLVGVVVLGAMVGVVAMVVLMNLSVLLLDCSPEGMGRPGGTSAD